MATVTTFGKSFSQLKNEVISTDSSKSPWELFVDDISLTVGDVVDLFATDSSGGYDPHDDYENLEKITVNKGVSDFASMDGCLFYKGFLVYAPVDKRTCISFSGPPDKIRVSKIFRNNDIWNGLYSKAIRTNISKFNWSNEKYFEELLMRYKDNIFKLFCNNLGLVWKDTGTDYIPRGIPFVNEIELSLRLKQRKHRTGSGSDIVYGDDREETGVEDSTNNPAEFDKKVKNPKDGCGAGETWDPTLGEYHNKKHKIVLYVEAIKRCAVINGLDLENLFLSVFIHEFFHAVHHTYCENYHPIPPSSGRGYDPFGGKKSTIIKESLADAFEYYFCEHVLQDVDLLRKMEVEWNTNDVSFYPYSGALNVRRSGMGESDINSRIHMSAAGCLDGLAEDINKLAPDGLSILYYFLWSIESMDDAQRDMLTR